MNKNSVIGFVLIAAIMIGYSLWLSPSKDEIQHKQHIKDSLEYVQFQQDSIRKDQIAKTKKHTEKALETRKEETTKVVNGKAPSSTYQAMHAKYDVFANSATGKNEKFFLENDLVKIEIDSKGGFIKQVQLKNYQTWDSLPLLLFDPNSMNFGLSFFLTTKPLIPTTFIFVLLEKPQQTLLQQVLILQRSACDFMLIKQKVQLIQQNTSNICTHFMVIITCSISILI